MKTSSLGFFVLALSVSACQRGVAPGPNTSEGSGVAVAPTGGTSAALSSSEVDAKPEALWQAFAQAWNSGDTSELARFRAQSGLLGLDNPGAFVRVRHFSGTEALRALEGEYDLARLKGIVLRPVLASGEAPRPSCETEVRASGTFIAPPERLLLDKRVAALREYQLASKAEMEQMEPAVQAARTEAQWAIYDLDANVGFLFGKEAGRLVLLAIDAVVPCSA
jgi:hypothetical protein